MQNPLNFKTKQYPPNNIDNKQISIKFNYNVKKFERHIKWKFEFFIKFTKILAWQSAHITNIVHYLAL